MQLQMIKFLFAWSLGGATFSSIYAVLSFRRTRTPQLAYKISEEKRWPIHLKILSNVSQNRDFFQCSFIVLFISNRLSLHPCVQFVKIYYLQSVDTLLAFFTHPFPVNIYIYRLKQVQWRLHVRWKIVRVFSLINSTWMYYKYLYLTFTSPYVWKPSRSR